MRGFFYFTISFILLFQNTNASTFDDFFEAPIAHGYQIGPKWDRTPYSKRLTLPDTVKKVVTATASVNTIMFSGDATIGTAFFAGVYQGEYVMVTNNHVMPEDDCSRTEVKFTALDLTLKCKKWLGTWPD